MRESLHDAIARAIGRSVQGDPQSVEGGSIHRTFVFRTSDDPVFVKVCRLEAKPMLDAEAAGLEEIAAAAAIRVPQVLAIGQQADQAFLCLEWLSLVDASAVVHARLGEQLAALHLRTSDQHGWSRANFIGRTPQQNEPAPDWVAFFRSQRLMPQIELAKRNGADARTLDLGLRLCEHLQAFFKGYAPKPSLLHGDLWGGNWGSLQEGEPVVFDPAVYFGDRETDIAMTRLFGGFDAQFYAAYQASYPLEAGAEIRTVLYNLYHVLNHFNLFGGGYLAQARSMLERLSAEY